MFCCSEHVGRVNASVALEVKLACLALGWRRGRVRCRRNNVELQVDAEVVSRWHHWYAEWEPSKFTQLDTIVSSMTTIQRTWLLQFVKSSDVSVALVARVHVGTREHRYEDHSVDVTNFGSIRNRAKSSLCLTSPSCELRRLRVSRISRSAQPPGRTNNVPTHDCRESQDRGDSSCRKVKEAGFGQPEVKCEIWVGEATNLRACRFISV